jgi:reductive dehalogenase
MKGLGLTSVGLGAAVGAAPVFHDLDELVSSSKAGRKLPWYVKEVDQPTVEIDWSRAQRRRANFPDPYGPAGTSIYGISYGSAPYSPNNSPQAISLREEIDKIGLVPGVVTDNWKKDLYPNAFTNRWMQQNIPGFTTETIRDVALHKSIRATDRYAYSPAQAGKTGWLGFQAAPTPEDFGAAKWEGTPEENWKMIVAAARMYGASRVGAIELNENTKKLICATASNGKRIVLDTDDAMPTETATEYRYPSRFKWAIVFYFNGHDTLRRYMPSWLGVIAVRDELQSSARTQTCTQEFLRGLGYQGLAHDGLCRHFPTGAGAVFSGIGEHARLSIAMVTPDAGVPTIATSMITDLPLAPGKPIDAGINRFCYTCKICAEACPTQMLMHGDPTWEPDPEFTPQVLDAPYMHKGWFGNNRTCINCGCSVCISMCPMNHTNKESPLHAVVGASAASVPIFNKFFADMDRTFGYNQAQDPAEWWDIESPVRGINPKW